MNAISFAPLAEREPEETVLSARGTTTAFDLLTSYNRLLENTHEMAYYHFEMLNLAYGAYLTFLEFCRSHFPAITDDLVARMVAGIDVILYRPDAELRRLAARAVELGVGHLLKAPGDPEQIIGSLGDSAPGKEWLEDLKSVKEPWFHYTTGAGYCHANRTWLDDLRPPFTALRDYVTRVERGQIFSSPGPPPRRTRANRHRLPEPARRRGRGHLRKPAQSVPAGLSLRRKSQFLRRALASLDVLQQGPRARSGPGRRGHDRGRRGHILPPPLRSVERPVRVAGPLVAGVPTRGEFTWRQEIARRRRIYAELETWTPSPALGVPPDKVTEPITVTLFGINNDTIDRWLAAEHSTASDHEFKGLAASPGTAEGVARVVQRVEDLDALEDGEILVCPLTAPSWSIVFARIAAAVSDGGGIMSHAAIVSREYELPAVVATGVGTQLVTTGDRLRVDGNTGVVTFLARVGEASAS